MPETNSRTLNVKVLNVCKTTEQWAAETAVISKGLLCVELASENITLVKIGDGVKTYAQLPYITDGSFSISDYSTTTEVTEMIDTKLEALGNIIRIKGIKPTAAELPTEGNELGDLWFVGTAGETTDSFAEYIWTSANKFEFLGRVQTDVDLSGYATTTYVDGKVQDLVNRIEALEAAEYSLPTASATVLGGVKVGEDLQIDENGVLTTNIQNATDTTAGLMSPEDKATISEIETYDLSAFIKDTDNLTLNCEL